MKNIIKGKEGFKASLTKRKIKGKDLISHQGMMDQKGNYRKSSPNSTKRGEIVEKLRKEKLKKEKLGTMVISTMKRGVMGKTGTVETDIEMTVVETERDKGKGEETLEKTTTIMKKEAGGIEGGTKTGMRMKKALQEV